jgi:regulator of sigma E protease
MEILMTVGAIAACVLLFAFAIFIHEFGHFLAAKCLGFKVDVFSIGFGPALWKKTVGGVEYRVSAIPFGGYVSLPQLDPAGTKALENGSAGNDETAPVDMPAWKRIVVAVAGPFGNVVLAVLLAVGLSCVPSARFGEWAPEIGSVVPDGPAAKGGLQAGDLVTAVNGRAVRTWTEMQTEVQLAGEKAASFDVRRGGTNVTLSVQVARDAASGACYILALSTTNGVKAASWMPARSPWKQLAWDAGNITRVLKALVTPKEAKSAAKALGGPVMIAEGLYTQVRRNGWDALGFLRFLNVNLAILNLLPIPVLDGGLILFALFELLFRRKLPKKLTDGLSMAFMWLFLALMVTLVFRDVTRSRRIHRAEAEYERLQRQLRQAEEKAKQFRPAFDLGGEKPVRQGR